VKAKKSKAKHEWKRLEKRALRLVSKDLQANYSAGGPRCKLSGYQVDAYGIFGKVAIVFECKTTAADRRININKAVDQLAGRRPAICRALQERHGRQLKYFRFVIIVGNASEIIPYTQRSRKPKDIYVWSPKYFDAIEGLAKGIKGKAVAYILKELHVRNLRACLPQSIRHCIVPAIRVSTRSNGDGTMYLFFATAQSLLDLCYVARVESDHPMAYQRLLNRAKNRRVYQRRRHIQEQCCIEYPFVCALSEKDRIRAWEYEGVIRAINNSIRPGEFVDHRRTT
jgi:hypothetical protein